MMEALAAALDIAQFVLSAIATGLAVMLFRHYRQIGWLLLAVAFLSPFAFLVLRLVHGLPLLTYRSQGPIVNGLAQVTIHYDIPGFYLLVVAALVWLWRDARGGR